jgi:chromosome segregation ATPase
MEKAFSLVPRVAIFLAGVAAGALTLSRRERSGVGADPGVTEELKSSISRVESRLTAQDSVNANRFQQIETRLDEHAGKLAEVPSTAQIVAAMEQLLTKTMASLDNRLTTQASSIDVLKTTVSQTDSLLERVLESLDSLQTYTDSAALGEESILHPSV